MVYFIWLRSEFTGGENGIQAVPRGRLFFVLDLNHTMVLYYSVLGIFLLGFLLIRRIFHSPFGQVLKAIRENEPRSISLGSNPNQYNLFASLRSSALPGLPVGAKPIAFP